MSGPQTTLRPIKSFGQAWPSQQQAGFKVHYLYSRLIISADNSVWAMNDSINTQKTSYRKEVPHPCLELCSLLLKTLYYSLWKIILDLYPSSSTLCTQCSSPLSTMLFS